MYSMIHLVLSKSDKLKDQEMAASSKNLAVLRISIIFIVIQQSMKLYLVLVKQIQNSIVFIHSDAIKIIRSFTNDLFIV